MPIEILNLTPLLEVHDMRRSVAFYCDNLGFEVTANWEPDGHLYWAMLKRGHVTLMLNARHEDHERPDAPDPRTVEAHADTELYFACPDVDQARNHLREQGVDAPEPEVTHYGMRQLWLTDPDGFRLCLQQPAEQ